mmetsp:Transcript_31480/g.77167  ORF Transcript_31480/g.77167 Transcript_31480/m.77167 type:complete len:274 (+) Transcript_31480:293-1114(+)
MICQTLKSLSFCRHCVNKESTHQQQVVELTTLTVSTGDGLRTHGLAPLVEADRVAVDNGGQDARGLPGVMQGHDAAPRGWQDALDRRGRQRGDLIGAANHDHLRVLGSLGGREERLENEVGGAEMGEPVRRGKGVVWGRTLDMELVGRVLAEEALDVALGPAPQRFQHEHVRTLAEGGRRQHKGNTGAVTHLVLPRVEPAGVVADGDGVPGGDDGVAHALHGEADEGLPGLVGAHARSHGALDVALVCIHGIRAGDPLEGRPLTAAGGWPLEA